MRVQFHALFNQNGLWLVAVFFVMCVVSGRVIRIQKISLYQKKWHKLSVCVCLGGLFIVLSSSGLGANIYVGHKYCIVGGG